MLTFNARLPHMVKHNSIANEMAIIGHQNPMMQKRKCFLGEKHAIGIDKSLRFNQRTGTHYTAIQAAKQPAGR